MADQVEPKYDLELNQRSVDDRERRAVEGIRNAINLLNASLEEAQEAALCVTIDYTTTRRFDRRFEQRTYSASVMRPLF